MTGQNKGFLGKYWPLWGLNFAFHLLLGLVATIAGLVVIFSIGEVLNGLALVGAGSFGLINGWQGCRDLVACMVHKKQITLKGNHR